MKYNIYNYILQLLLGVLLISVIFYNRILRIRLPKEVHNYFLQFDFLIYFSLSIISIVVFIIALRNYDKNYVYFREDNIVEKFNWWQKAFFFISNYIKNSVFILYRFFLKKNTIFFLYEKLIRGLSTLLKGKEVYYQRIVYITIIVPKFIVSLIFLIDIFYFHQLNFFYKALILLLIPIIVKSFCVMLEDYKTIKEDIWFCEYLEQSEDASGTPCVIVTKKAPCSIEQFYDQEHPFILFIGSLGYFGNICSIELTKSSLLALCTYFFYALGWTYLLFNGLNFFWLP